MKAVFTFCMLLSVMTMNAQESLLGVWNTGTDNSKIEIAEVDGTYEGKLVSSDNAKAKIGKLIIKDLKSVDGEWKGKLFAAKKGKWLDAVFKEKGNQLLVTVGSGWKSKTLEWTKEQFFVVKKSPIKDDRAKVVPAGGIPA